MFRKATLAAWLAAAVGIGGCESGPGFGDVSGTVTYDGKPLPGGEVIITNEADNLMASGYLSPEGTYSIKQAPAGPVRVIVRNEELKHQIDEKTVKALQRKGVPIVIEKNPGKGTKYVPVPARYASRETSELKYEVKKNEANKIDIVLTK
jgi:hypothetical protein